MFIEYVYYLNKQSDDENKATLEAYAARWGQGISDAITQCVECPEEFVLTVNKSPAMWRKNLYLGR